MFTPIRAASSAALATVLVLTTAGLSAATTDAMLTEQSIVVAGPAIVGGTDARMPGSGTDAVFYPTGEISDDTLVVIPNDDGTLPFGLTRAQVTTLAALSPAARDAALADVIPAEAVGTSSLAPAAINPGHSYTATAAWSSAWSGNNIWGYDESAKVSYVFSVTQGTNQQAAGLGLGYYRGYNGSQMGVWSSWYGLGIASSNSNGGATVPWGSVLATAKFKAMSTIPLHLAIGRFWP